MQNKTDRAPLYWERSFGREVWKRGDELAALRRGINAVPGTAPTMWRFYTSTHEGRHLDAEHYALTLFAIHQQSKRSLVHKEGVPVASALRKLHTKFEEAAVDRRFFAAVTALEVSAVAYHLRGLIRQLHSLPTDAPFDYTKLFWDLAAWAVPERRPRIQRSWGLSYYGASRTEEASDDQSATEQNREGAS